MCTSCYVEVVVQGMAMGILKGNGTLIRNNFASGQNIRGGCVGTWNFWLWTILISVFFVFLKKLSTSLGLFCWFTHFILDFLGSFTLGQAIFLMLERWTRHCSRLFVCGSFQCAGAVIEVLIKICYEGAIIALKSFFDDTLISPFAWILNCTDDNFGLRSLRLYVGLSFLIEVCGYFVLHCMKYLVWFIYFTDWLLRTV